MGYSLSWAAVKNGKPEAIHCLLGLRATDAWGELPASKTVGASLPTGWYLVSFQRKEVGDHILTKLSSMGEVVYCFVEDHVMFSRASGWKDGKFLWSITHDCEKGKYHLEIKGDAPPSLKNIHANPVAEQDAEQEADVDRIYDAPAELAKNLTGFRHDQDTPGMKDKPFQVLEKGLFSAAFSVGRVNPAMILCASLSGLALLCSLSTFLPSALSFSGSIVPKPISTPTPSPSAGLLLSRHQAETSLARITFPSLPAVLTNLPAGFADLRAGKATCKPESPGKQLCTVRDCTFFLCSVP